LELAHISCTAGTATGWFDLPAQQQMRTSSKTIAKVPSHCSSIGIHEAIFRCPNSGSQLRELTAKEIENLNQAIASGAVKHLDGSAVRIALREALICDSGGFVYPIVDGIICFLPHLAISSAGKVQNDQCEGQLVVKELTEFYDEFGWQKSDDGNFCDAAVFEDLRAVAADYVHNCHMRVNRYLTQGQYLLDVASGPVQFDEYLSYSEQFAYRICVDVSLVALREARRRVGPKGIFVLADITNLPFGSDSIDAVVSLHTIYHVDASRQPKAFDELYRVVKPAGTAVIVYTWGRHCRLMSLLDWPAAITKPLRLALKRRSKNAADSLTQTTPTIYFRPQAPDWFARQDWDFELDMVVWRSLSVTFLKTYVHEVLLGRQLLRLIYWLEDRCPFFMGRFGQYPMFILRKNQ
jgi:ubiquinone/menaquinone biosynthesis C-methylase UbiE/uncharacterized protein YbaR (Trm112 family)